MINQGIQLRLSEANEKLRVLFRKYRRKDLLNRQGVVLVVDDVPEQQQVLDEMAKARLSSIEVECVESMDDAQSVIEKSGEDGIKIVVVDLVLNGHGDGFQLIEWMSEYYPSLPYIVITGRLEKVDELKERFPGVDILIKGQSTINDYADAMGLPSEVGYNGVVPVDEKRLDTAFAI